jgi:hypothetical protein
MMSNSPNEFQDIIEQLVPIIQAPDFDVLFKAITFEHSKPQQFQIKLTLNELKKACPRYIDLRGHVDGSVRPYVYDNKTHYMDDMAIKVFERELSHYGSFTMGVYQEVSNTENNFRVRHQKEQKQRLKEKTTQKPRAENPVEEAEELVTHLFTAKKVQFQSYAIRCEERMNYSISVELQIGLGDSFKAATSDLSVSGCKVKLPLETLVEPGQYVTLHFRGLEEEFALGLANGVEYEVVASEELGHFQYVRMKRSYSENIQSFDEFLNNFINGNKRRYKVNMENTEEAVIIKGYEQYYIPRITALPIFVGDHNGQLSIKAVLTTENNKYVLQYWRNETQVLVIPKVFTQKRLEVLLDGPQETILYSFTHTRQGRVSHYAAFAEELENDEHLKHLFFGFGSQKLSWRVHKVQLMQASYDNAHIPLSLPDSASDEVKFLNRPPSPRVASVLQHTRMIIALTDISEFKKVKQYQSFAYNLKAANDLKVFGLPTDDEQQKIEIVAVDYVNLRKETRFLYQTEVSVELPPMKGLKGNTRDFSTKGMQIELDETCELVKDDVVLINLPQLQKITRNFKLSRLPYEVVTISKSKKIINVRVYEHGEKHTGKKFFQQLIQNNRSKLTAAEESQSVPGLPLAMRNMYVNVCANMPFYIHRKGIRYMLNMIGRGGRDNSLHNIMAKFSEPGSDYHTYPLTKNNKSMKRQDAPVTCELLVRVKRNERQPESAITIEISQDLRTAHSHQKFITEAQQEDLFFCYRLMLSRTGRPDIDYISKELKYVGNYAIHRAKVLEEELWSVIGVADAIDISDEVMMRYGFSDTDIKIQQQAKQFYFTESSDF